MSFFPVISGPVALFNNLPIEPQFFKPSQFVITGLTYGITTTVTMANGTNNVVPNYVLGQQVRLLLPSKYGARQLNEQTGFVISIPGPTQVVVSINSLGTDPFISTPLFLPFQSRTPPQIVAIGDINSGLIYSTGTIQPSPTIAGTFQNISPI